MSGPLEDMDGGHAERAEPGNEAISPDQADDDLGNRVEGGSARAVLGYLARSLADEPEAVVIETDDSGRTTRFRIHVAPGDMGRMIGRRGRVAQAIRTLVRVAGSRDGMDTNVDFVDD
ncbi:MAG TPA: KH domain-containing protein [Acidimicrobiales bacterium]|nr:KH domain-containing protein [Acidimicrobiales bacterium]